MEQTRRTLSGARPEATIQHWLWEKVRHCEQALRSEFERVVSERTPHRVAALERELEAGRRQQAWQARKLEQEDEEIHRLRSCNRNLMQMQFGRSSGGRSKHE